jgi:hypothetical protein
LDRGNGDYWPDGVPRTNTVLSFIALFATLGFAPCETQDLEAGVEKLAIYLNETGTPEHIARQLPNGSWTSKMGWALEDIEHDSLTVLEGEQYGIASVFLARRLSG